MECYKCRKQDHKRPDCRELERKMPIRGQEIGCPPEITLENTIVQITKYVWLMLKWMLKM